MLGPEKSGNGILPLFMDQGLYEVVQLASCQDLFQIMLRDAYTMIRDSSLREVVRSYPFGPVARANLQITPKQVGELLQILTKW